MPVCQNRNVIDKLPNGSDSKLWKYDTQMVYTDTVTQIQA